MAAEDNVDAVQRRLPQGRRSDREGIVPAPADGAIDAARGKLLQVFHYLRALNELRNPACEDIREQHWVLWLDDLPTHPCIQFDTTHADAPDAPDEELSDDSVAESSVSAGYVLRVKRPTLTPCPEPPRQLLLWLLDGWQHPDADASVASQLEPTVLAEEAHTDTIGSSETFAADPSRQRLLDEWRARRDVWAREERPARQAMDVFERLYRLLASIERESERLELMLGDGVLRWDVAGSHINHPVLLTRLQLTFDPAIPEFTLVETDQLPELYTAPLRRVTDLNPSSLKRSREDVAKGNWHPLGGVETSTFFRRFASQLSAKAELVDTKHLPKQAGEPYIYRRPVIFVRSRTLGFGAALEAILEHLPGASDIPQSLLNIVGISTDRVHSASDSGPAALFDLVNGDDEDVLLSKPANAEQLEIARKLERDGAVLVQGPPGTGKTHTIANMLGHLLAQGKSVLVTSHTAKALTVLREQVVEPLQPLCVSVLDDSRTQVAAAVDAITERLATSDADTLERGAASVRRERLAILGKLRASRARLLQARQDEYRPIVLAGEEIPPSQAARRVAAGAASASWIPAPVILGEPLPLSPGEVAELYRTNGELSAADELQLTSSLPAPEDLLTPEVFASCVTELSALEPVRSDRLTDLWRGAPRADIEEPLQRLSQRLEKSLAPLRGQEQWRLAAIAAGHAGGGHQRAWEDLVAQIDSTYHEAAEAEPLVMRAAPVLPADFDVDRGIGLLEDLVAFVKSGGKLTWLRLAVKPDWRALVEGAQVRGSRPEHIQDFEALLALARREQARRALVSRWQVQMARLGAPSVTELGPTPEEVCRQYAAPLRECLAWYRAQWEPLQAEMEAWGLNWERVLAEVPPRIETYGDLMRLREAALTHLPTIFAVRIRQARLAGIDEQVRHLRERLVRYGSGAQTADVVITLRAAVDARDAQHYQTAFERLLDLHRRTTALASRRTLLERLERVAPAWAAAIRGRHGLHGESIPPGDAAEAWEWRQLHDELEQRSRTSLEELQSAIAQLSTELREKTASLVEMTAWASQVRRTTLQQRQALQGWKQLVRKAGRGTGIRAPRLLAEARRLMPICQTAVPVWIMPLSRVVDNFDVTRNRFDVVIIDEASQADMMALIAVYMAKQVVVVGDDEQVSPLAVGQKQAEIQRIIDEHLVGVPQRELYDGQYSIYELAQTSFQPVILLEHFRCVSPIIQFSNYLSYGGKIKPLRDASTVKRVPPTVAYRVEAGEPGDRVNEEEAVTIASLLAAAIDQPEYATASFGVISMVGEEQAKRIDTLLQHYLSPVQYTSHRVQCGNSAQFQGDERDVMFLSMVDVSADGAPLPLRNEGQFNLFKKRFNVAASRARDQLWVVYSMDPETHLKPGDLRRRLIQHAQDPLAVADSLERHESRTESEFERLVLRRLVEAGYKVVPQWPVGAYRIDMVVEGGDKTLAVECDGDRWHPHSKLEDDMARQAILERLGWRFVRVRGSQFFRDPDRAMEPVFARLRDLEVRPEGAVTESQPGTSDNELKGRIVRRASELRAQWVADPDETLGSLAHQAQRVQAASSLLSTPQKAADPSPLPITPDDVLTRELQDMPAPPTPAPRMLDKEIGTATEPISREARPQTQPPIYQGNGSNSASSPPSQRPPQFGRPVRSTQGASTLGREQNVSGGMSASDAVALLRSKRLEIIDNRSKGGVLWVVGGPGLAPVFDDLKRHGVHFTFVREGSRATSHRPAWFLDREHQ